MDNLKLTEKELLILKGNALRMRFRAEIDKTKKGIIHPLQNAKQTGLALVSLPTVKTFALDLLLKRFVTVKSVGISILGIAALYFLQHKQKQEL